MCSSTWNQFAVPANNGTVNINFGLTKYKVDCVGTSKQCLQFSFIDYADNIEDYQYNSRLALSDSSVHGGTTVFFLWSAFLTTGLAGLCFAFQIKRPQHWLGKGLLPSLVAGFMFTFAAMVSCGLLYLANEHFAVDYAEALAEGSQLSPPALVTWTFVLLTLAVLVEVRTYLGVGAVWSKLNARLRGGIRGDSSYAEIGDAVLPDPVEEEVLDVHGTYANLEENNAAL
jgi:hypothetical protein